MSKAKNEMEIVFDAVSENEGFARMAVVAFIMHLNPTMEEMADIKTAVSEAVTNSIIHGYEGMEDNEMRKIRIHCSLEHSILHICVRDKGKGIENIEQAMEPLFTTKPEMGRSGMGFSFMEAFMDDVEVESTLGVGTTVKMIKRLGLDSWIDDGE